MLAERVFLMRFLAAGDTDVGRKRRVNQDHFMIDDETGVFVVADGMGGHAGGEYASRCAVETIHKSVVEDREAALANAQPTDLVMASVHRANHAVFNKGREDENLRGMGTTVDVMLFDDKNLFIGHVGDSRVYMLRKGMIWQLTRDHSLVNEKLKAGLITREQMKTDQNKNVITRSVGFESSVLVDIYKREFEPGEIYMACSDGLSGMIDDDEILAIVDEHCWEEDDLSGAITKLIKKANDAGGDDNITVVLVKTL